MRLIIIGGVAGGATAAARARRLSETAAILVVLALAVGTYARQATGQNSRPTGAPTQKIDQEYTKRILDATPDKRILTELVDHMPASATVPSPLKFFGYVPGEGTVGDAGM
jgi:hypothetical protein